MAKAKEQDPAVDHFAEAAKIAEETSSDSANSTYELALSPKDGNGGVVAEHRGLPGKGN